MEVGRSSISKRSDVVNNSFSLSFERAKLASGAKDDPSSCRSGHQHHEPRQQQQHHHLKSRTTSMKMFNKVQVVYYLTRNGQLEHPHFLEVSHLVTQPLRLKDVLDRLTVLRGKAMPCQYSWSCKRSYRNGYVWNDLTENDVIHATEGSEYVLKGSEIIHDSDFSEIGSDEVQNKRTQQRKGSQLNTSGLVTNKSGGTHQGCNYSQVTSKNCEQETVKSYEQTENRDNDEEEEEDEKGSCNSSNAPYSNMQIEQEESYSLPSTSSTNSDKQPQQPAPTQVAKTSSASETKRSDKEAAAIVQEDGDTTISTSLARNSTALLHLIACGGGMASPQGKPKAKEKINNAGGSNRNFNFSMKNSFMPCLKQQLSTRGVAANTNAVPLRLKGVREQRHDDQQVVRREDEDEDMMMVRFMSENPRFGNLQSEDKEYFSGTIVEAMSTHHQHTPSIDSATSHPHPYPHPPPVVTKSSSYNEQRSSKAGLQGAASKVEDEDDEKEDAKVKGIIKLCIPRKKSSSSTSTKHT